MTDYPNQNRLRAIRNILQELSEDELRTVVSDAFRDLPLRLRKDVAIELAGYLHALRKEVALEMVKALREEERRALLHDALMNLPSETRNRVIIEAVRADRKTGHSAVVHFSDKAYDAITEIMRKSRTAGSLSAVLTQALAFEKWYRDAIAADNHVFVDRGSGDLREVKRP